MVTLFISYNLAFYNLALELGFGLFELAHAFTDAARQLRNFFGSEQKKDNEEDYDHLLHSRGTES